MKTAAIIPARYGSTRFPGKVLAELDGKPIVRWVWENARRSRADRVIIATDDERVRTAARTFGAECVMTSPNHATGSDRIWEAASGIDAEILINVQGDEPLIEPEVINGLIDALEDPSGPDIATVAVIHPRKEFENNPNCVKVVFDEKGYALYFSRSMIPYLREGGTDTPTYRHWGLYAYRRAALERFVSLPKGRLEQCESLEQLRALENGMKIKVITTEFQSIGIDTPEDLKNAELWISRLKKEKQPE